MRYDAAGRGGKPVDLPDEWWDLPNVSDAVETRDVASIYAVLQRYGLSQRGIARLTGQSQSEVSEVRSGRTTTSYPVLVRIAEGLQIPRHRMGLSYNGPAGEPPDELPVEPSDEPLDEPLAHPPDEPPDDEDVRPGPYRPTSVWDLVNELQLRVLTVSNEPIGTTRTRPATMSHTRAAENERW